MFEKSSARVRRSRFAVAATALGTLLIAVGTGAGAAQDKYTLQVPNGLPFSDFKGYEDWQVVAVSQTDALLKVMVANPTMIAAYKAGIPGNGKPFPDGSKIAKIEWKPKKSTEAPFDVRIPESLQDVFFIEKDSKRFPDTKGWAYAVFDSRKSLISRSSNPSMNHRSVAGFILSAAQERTRRGGRDCTHNCAPAQSAFLMDSCSHASRCDQKSTCSRIIPTRTGPRSRL